jgi:uncharacterized protein YodC (DUF2158 family)
MLFAEKGTAMPKRKEKRTPSAGFAVGDRVRVKRGVKDFDYPDLTLGGWAATISEIQKDGTYTVRWTKKTLEAISPVYKKRCDRDGCEYETYWIAGKDLEPDPGGPLEIEQPTKITTKPLSKKNQDDRIRMVFALTSNDPLPDVNNDTLMAYAAFLADELSFPFEATHEPEHGRAAQMKVLGVADTNDELMVDEHFGIFCEARLDRRVVTVPLAEVDRAKGTSNRRLVDDYNYWFWNWR